MRLKARRKEKWEDETPRALLSGRYPPPPGGLPASFSSPASPLWAGGTRMGSSRRPGKILDQQSGCLKKTNRGREMKNGCALALNHIFVLAECRQKGLFRGFFLVGVLLVIHRREMLRLVEFCEAVFLPLPPPPTLCVFQRSPRSYLKG